MVELTLFFKSLGRSGELCHTVWEASQDKVEREMQAGEKMSRVPATNNIRQLVCRQNKHLPWPGPSKVIWRKETCQSRTACDVLCLCTLQQLSYSNFGISATMRQKSGAFQRQKHVSCFNTIQHPYPVLATYVVRPR